MPIDFAESVVAAVGIEPFLFGGMRRVPVYQLARAAKLPDEIARKLHRFLVRDEREAPAALPPFDFDTVVELIEREVTPAEVEQQIGALGDSDLAVQVNVVAQRIRDYLFEKIPRRVHQSLAGPVRERPAHSDVARFRRTWRVACDPLSVLDELNEYALSRDEVKAMSEMFPGVWGAIEPINLEQMTRAREHRPTWTLPRRKETMLRVLIKQEAPNIALAKAMQAVHAENAAARVAPVGTKSRASGMDVEATPTQRLDA